MARIRPRAQGSADPGTVAGRPLSGPVEPPPDEALDDLAGVEAFAPRPEGDPEDPFQRAFAEDRRPLVADGQEGLARTSLLVAVAVCLIGLLAIGLGVVDDDDEVRGDDVAAGTSTSTTTRSSSTSTSASTSSTLPGSLTTSTTAGLGPGATPTTVRRTTITTVRPSTTLPRATTTTALVNGPLEARIELAGEPVAGETVVVVITLADPDAVPTTNCLDVVARALGETTLVDDTCETECPDGAPPVEAEGGTRRIEIPYDVPDATTSFEIEVLAARSGIPECGNPFASVLEGAVGRSFPVSPAS